MLLTLPSAVGDDGFIECYGYYAAAGYWLFSGWMRRPSTIGHLPIEVIASFTDGDIHGQTMMTFSLRNDLPDGAQAVSFSIHSELAVAGALPDPLRYITLVTEAGMTTLWLADGAAQLQESQLIPNMKDNLVYARPSPACEQLLNLLARQSYNGDDTLDRLSPGVFLYLDEVIRCGPNGLLLTGWALAKPAEITRLSLRSGERVTRINMAEAIRIQRIDVIAKFSVHGFDDAMCGFVMFLPDAFEPGTKPYLEIETNRCEVAYRNIDLSSRTGLAAIKHLLEIVDPRFGAFQEAFDRVLGPAVQALNDVRLQTRPTEQLIEYGTMPAKPKYSVIVPLHGRIDFAEYQIALFSVAALDDVEYIYVLDDPEQRWEARSLFASIHERFLVPFRAILLDQNVGFAPANNIGLRHAKGDFVAYLNSDVFPGSLDWLPRLAERLTEDPALGVIGPILLYEDGSIQHQGMYFKRLPEYGDWHFCLHANKGRRYNGGQGVIRSLAITGACMVMRRELAERLGGFDENYVVGDFEDSDLCLKLIGLGLESAVDTDVTLYHLERKSQASAAAMWRSNLTAYNAWRHERNWGQLIQERQDAPRANRL